LCTDAGEVFLDRYGELIELSASGQLAMRKVFDEHLKRVEWDARQFPVRLYPFISAEAPDSSRPIAIDPHVAFGRPVVQRAGISTVTIADRIDAGETVADLAADYGLSAEEIEQTSGPPPRMKSGSKQLVETAGSRSLTTPASATSPMSWRPSSGTAWHCWSSSARRPSRISRDRSS
jgi:uncharacterized protein (DUF433 family)